MTVALTGNAARCRQSGRFLVSRTLSIGIAVGVLLSIACASSPKGPTGSLLGIAVDNNGNPLPGITVSLHSAAGKIVQEVLTSADGSYRFEGVPVGSYQVTTNFPGFTAPKPLDVTVAAGATANLPHLVLVPPQ